MAETYHIRWSDAKSPKRCEDVEEALATGAASAILVFRGFADAFVAYVKETRPGPSFPIRITPVRITPVEPPKS